MTKFKVGDEVRILDGSKIRGYRGNFVDRMKDYIGETATIRDVDGHEPIGYYLKGYPYIWDERGLELASPETIVIYRKGNEVIALDKSTGKKAIARCNPADTFDFMTGAKLAFERLTSTRELLNTKICITDIPFTPSTCHLTVGKIYEVKDGKFTNDAGDIYPLCDPLHNIEELRGYLAHNGQPQIMYYASVSINFVEVVE